MGGGDGDTVALKEFSKGEKQSQTEAPADFSSLSLSAMLIQTVNSKIFDECVEGARGLCKYFPRSGASRRRRCRRL